MSGPAHPPPAALPDEPAAVPATAVTWAVVLDDMERRLGDVERGLRTGVFATTAVDLPGGLGPIPDALRQRAQRLLQATVAAEQEVEKVRERIADALRRGRTTSAPFSAYVDTRL
ncbi:MAG TPA: hypothetical protein VMB72_14310 [Acidimicrobiales bacterium]|nr:hypothetical protein [Acidimicrobiales bacterium]